MFSFVDVENDEGGMRRINNFIFSAVMALIITAIYLFSEMLFPSDAVSRYANQDPGFYLLFLFPLIGFLASYFFYRDQVGESNKEALKSGLLTFSVLSVPIIISLFYFGYIENNSLDLISLAVSFLVVLEVFFLTMPSKKVEKGKLFEHTVVYKFVAFINTVVLFSLTIVSIHLVVFGITSGFFKELLVEFVMMIWEFSKILAGVLIVIFILWIWVKINSARFKTYEKKKRSKRGPGRPRKVGRPKKK